MPELEPYLGRGFSFRDERFTFDIQDLRPPHAGAGGGVIGIPGAPDR